MVAVVEDGLGGMALAHEDDVHPVERRYRDVRDAYEILPVRRQIIRQPLPALSRFRSQRCCSKPRVGVTRQVSEAEIHLAPETRLAIESQLKQRGLNPKSPYQRVDNRISSEGASALFAVRHERLARLHHLGDRVLGSLVLRFDELVTRDGAGVVVGVGFLEVYGAAVLAVTVAGGGRSG